MHVAGRFSTSPVDKTVRQGLGSLGLALVAALLFLAACSSGDGSDEATGDDKAPKTQIDNSSVQGVAYEIALPEIDSEVVSLDDEELALEHAFVSFEAVIEAGVDAGVWNEAEGVVAVLKTLVGELPESSIDVWDEVASPSFSGVIDMAVELLDDPLVDDVLKDDINRLTSMVVPSVDEMFPELATGNEATGGESSYGQLVRVQQSDCVTPAFEKFPDVTARKEVACWKMIETRSTHRFRVVFPKGQEELAQTALDGMVLTDTKMRGWGAKGSDVTLLVTPANNPNALGIATVNPNYLLGDECVISMFAGGFDPKTGGSDYDFGQVVAHEQVHCHQFASFTTLGPHSWIYEPIADLYSHLVMPEGGTERLLIPHFMINSLSSSLDEMTYENWVWWMFMVNETSEKEVWELQGRLLRTGLAGLAAEPNIDEKFQRFTIDLVTVGIPTRSTPVPASSRARSLTEVQKARHVELEADQFVAARFAVRYVKSHLFTQDDQTKSDGISQMAPVPERFNRDAWRGVPPEVRTRCDDPVSYVVAATTIHPDTHKFTYEVTEAEEFGCDSCLGGTWIMDNETFASAIVDKMSDIGGMPPGMSMTFELVGDYFTRFDGEGNSVSWRNGYEIRTHANVSGNAMTMTVIVDSVETASYDADGKNFRAWNAVTLDYTSRANMGGIQVAVNPNEGTVSAFGQTVNTPGQGVDGPQSTGGSYTCNKERLEIALQDLDGRPVVFNRAVAPPEPPIVLPGDQ